MVHFPCKDVLLPRCSLTMAPISIPNDFVDALKKEVSTTTKIATPESKDYPGLVRRWAASAEKPAVSNLSSHYGPISVKQF